MNKKKILGYSVSALALAMVLSAGSASAFDGGRGGMGMMGGGFNKNLTPDQIATNHSTMFAEHASLIGATPEEVKDAWAKGVSFVELAKTKGVTEEALKSKMQLTQTTKMKAQLQALVTKGVITQAQADTRLSTMEKKMTEMKDKKGKGKQGKGKGFMHF